MIELKIKAHRIGELPNKAKKIAIEIAVDEAEMQGENIHAIHWALDDCSFFEPPHKEMAEILGEDYYDRNTASDGKYGQFVFKNTRKNMRSNNFVHLGIEITNYEMFYKWLGIHETFIRHFSADFTQIHIYDILSLDNPYLCDNPIKDMLERMYNEAQDKLISHLESLKGKIESSVEEYFSDENMEERLEEQGMLFTIEGRKIPLSLYNEHV